MAAVVIPGVRLRGECRGMPGGDEAEFADAAGTALSATSPLQEARRQLLADGGPLFVCSQTALAFSSHNGHPPIPGWSPPAVHQLRSKPGRILFQP